MFLTSRPYTQAQYKHSTKSYSSQSHANTAVPSYFPDVTSTSASGLQIIAPRTANYCPFRTSPCLHFSAGREPSPFILPGRAGCSNSNNRRNQFTAHLPHHNKPTPAESSPEILTETDTSVGYCLQYKQKIEISESQVGAPYKYLLDA